MDHLLLPNSIYQHISSTIGTQPVETGGIFSVKGNTITDFYFDADATTTSRCYTPNSERITEQVNRWLQESGKTLGGFIHSHPASLKTLSCMDIRAAMATMVLNQILSLYMAIVCQGQIYFYKIIHHPEKDIPVVESCSYEITDE